MGREPKHPTHPTLPSLRAIGTRLKHPHAGEFACYLACVAPKRRRDSKKPIKPHCMNSGNSTGSSPLINGGALIRSVLKNTCSTSLIPMLKSAPIVGSAGHTCHRQWRLRLEHDGAAAPGACGNQLRAIPGSASAPISKYGTPATASARNLSATSAQHFGSLVSGCCQSTRHWTPGSGCFASRALRLRASDPVLSDVSLGPRGKA